MYKILLGGSPCTRWSIAQTQNRETQAEGIGWELFKNYAIAKERFQPDFFLYENNKSAAPAIKNQICQELGHGLTLINSARVSAQTRWRFYVTPLGEHIPQPEDRGILLRDVLQSGRRQMVAEPIGITEQGKAYALKAQYYKSAPANYFNGGGHYPASGVAQPVQLSFDDLGPIRIGTIESGAKNTDFDSQQYRVYSADGKGVTLCGNGGGQGAKTGLYAVPYTGGKQYPIYEVQNGLITIKDKQYPIKLADGFYIIRKLTVTECERLQTLPDGYTSSAGVSATQCYKGLGNGWTAEVIIHILRHGLRNVPRDTAILALSMYDGIGTGRYCLDKLGFTNVIYKAYEIDKYAMQIANHNYPDIQQSGDAFTLRTENWRF